jgi:hypothetical protein
MKKTIFSLLLFFVTAGLAFGQNDTSSDKDKVITNLVDVRTLNGIVPGQNDTSSDKEKVIINLLDVRTLHGIVPEQNSQIIKFRGFYNAYTPYLNNLDSDNGDNWRNYYWRSVYSGTYQNDYEGPQKPCNDDNNCKK